MRDWLIEICISTLRHVMCFAHDAMQFFIKRRSHKQIERMEKLRGLL